MTQSVSLDELLSHREWVHRLARALVRDPMAADDLAQDAWVVALRAPPSDPDAVRGWFRRVMVNLSMNTRRGETRRVAREQRAPGAPAPIDPLDSVTHLEEMRRVVDAVLALTSPGRETVVLRYFEDLSPAQIGARMGVPASTVRSRLQRSLGTLRESLDGAHGGDGRTWRTALFPLIGAPRGSRSAKVGSVLAGASALGVLAMKWKTVATAAALLLALLAWSVTHAPTSDEEARTPAASAPGAESFAQRAAPPERRRVEAESETVEAPSVESADAPQSATGTLTYSTRYRLDVTILDPSGRPARGAKVSFWNQFDGIDDLVEIEEEEPDDHEATPRDRPARIHQTSGSSMVKADGRGRVQVLHTTQTARVWAEAGGATGCTEGFELSADEVTRVTLRLDPPIEARGRVTDTVGGGVRALVILETETTFGMQPSSSVWCDDNGGFTLANVPRAALSAQIQLRAVSENHVAEIRALRADDLAGREHEFALAAGHVVRGRFVDEKGAPVATARLGDGSPWGYVQSKADGTFVKRDLPAAGRTLRAESRGFAARDVVVPAFRGAETDLGDVLLRTPGSVSGLVLREDGAPYTFGSVMAVAPGTLDRSEASAAVEKDGTFTLTGIGEDAYRLVALVFDTVDERRFGRYIEQVGVRSGDEVCLQATDARSALVTLIDRTTRKPVVRSFCSVDITPGGSADRLYRQSFDTPSPGRIRVTFLEPGRHRLSFAVTGYADTQVDDVDVLPDRAIQLRVELTPRE